MKGAVPAAEVGAHDENVTCFPFALTYVNGGLHADPGAAYPPEVTHAPAAVPDVGVGVGEGGGPPLRRRQ